MKKIGLFLVLILFSFIEVQANIKESVKFGRCVDGDTAIFIIKDIETRVRFLGIDTPESVKANTVVEPYGKKASEYTCDKLSKAKNIVLEYDVNSNKVDKYNRTLAWVWIDDYLLEALLVQNGYAKVKYIYGDYSYVSLLYSLQDKAKEEKIGIWKEYIPEYYKVVFIDGDSDTVVDILEGNKVISFIPKKNGYKFVGWFNEDKEFDFNTRIYSNINLTARYEKDINIIEILLISSLLLTLYYFNNKKRKVNSHGRKCKVK